MIILRPYQDDLVEASRQAIRDKVICQCIVAPTGAGKTTVGSYMVGGVASRSKASLTVAHRRELIRQWSLTYASFGIYHDIIAASETIAEIKVEHVRKFGKVFYSASSNSKIASIQTLSSRIHKLGEWEPSLVIIDEGHHATAGSLYHSIFLRWPNCIKILLTATPERLDGKGLGVGFGGFAEKLILGPKIRWLLDNGFLTKYRLFGPPKRVEFNARTKFGDFRVDDIELAMDKPTITGDAISQYQKWCSGDPAIVGCTSIAHAEHVAEDFRRAGYRAHAVSGKTPSGERKRILDGLDNGYSQLVTFADLIGEGVDIPSIKALIGLRPTQSRSWWRQFVGRGLRLAPGKEHVYIFDHADNTFGQRHGMPCSEIDWTLEGDTDKGKRSTNEIEKIQRCPKCYAVHDPNTSCPICGHVYKTKTRKIEHEDGELVEISREAAEIMEQKKTLRKEQGRAKTLEELKVLEKKLGNKRGWAEHVFYGRKK